MSTWVRRSVGVAVAGTTSVLVAAVPAHADDTGMGEINTDLQDSLGNPVSDYLTLSLYGGGLNPADPQHIYEPLVQMIWALYATLVNGVIMNLNWVLSLTWVDFFLGPLRAFSSTMHVVMAELGLRPLMFVLLGALVGGLLLKGRTGAAVSELIVGAAIGALAVGMLVNPMNLIAGPNGAVTHAQGAGMDLAQAIATDGESLTAEDTSTVRNGLTASLIDTMVRTPHQFVNYGTALEGHPCEEVYDATLGQEDARLEMGECDSQLQEVADHPDPVRVITTLRLIPTALVFALFGWLIAIMAIGAVLLAGWCGVKLVWDLVIGIAGSRQGIFRSGANLALSLGVVMLTIAGVPAYMAIVRSVMSSAGGPLAILFRFDLVSIMLIIGLIVFVVARQRMKKALHRMGERLARLGSPHRGGQQPTRLPSPVQMGRQGLEAAHRLSSLTSRLGGSGSGGRPVPPAPRQPSSVNMPSTMTPHAHTQSPAASPAAALTKAGGPRRELLPGPGEAGPSRGLPGPRPGPPKLGESTAAKELVGDRLKRRLKQGSSAAAQIGMAVATGGSSAVATGGRAAVVAANASKAARVARVARTASQGAQMARRMVSRTPRNEALRARLHEVQHMPSQRTAGQVVDAGTGVEYKRVSGPGPGPEILRPVRDEPGESVASVRLRERLRGRRSA